MHAMLETISADVSETPEDSARADLYALAASLFLRPPDRALLDLLAAQAGEVHAPNAFVRSWSRLCTVAAATQPDQADWEFSQLFVSTGASPVNPYAAHYLEATGVRHVLPSLRAELATLRLSARPECREPEDHIAALCEVMRWLATGEARVALGVQSDFFSRYLRPWYRQFCATARAVEGLAFYAAAIDLFEVFMDLEAESFELNAMQKEG